MVMLPNSLASSIACAALKVSALKASSGVIFNCVQAKAIIKGILPLGEEPGL